MSTTDSTEHSHNRLRVQASILCGGRSSRFGSDKARIIIDGRAHLLRLCDVLDTCCRSVCMVADRSDRYQDLGLSCLIDRVPECGPMGGLEAAMQECSSRATRDQDAAEWILLISCDQLIWRAEWLDQLTQPVLDRDQNGSQSLQAAAFYSTAWQPLPALYHISLQPMIAARTERREQLSLSALLQQLHEQGRAAKLELAESPADWTFNTPDEFERLQRRLG